MIVGANTAWRFHHAADSIGRRAASVTGLPIALYGEEDSHAPDCASPAVHLSGAFALPLNCRPRWPSDGVAEGGFSRLRPRREFHGPADPRAQGQSASDDTAEPATQRP